MNYASPCFAVDIIMITSFSNIELQYVHFGQIDKNHRVCISTWMYTRPSCGTIERQRSLELVSASLNARSIVLVKKLPCVLFFIYLFI